MLKIFPSLPSENKEFFCGDKFECRLEKNNCHGEWPETRKNRTQEENFKKPSREKQDKTKSSEKKCQPNF